MAFSGHKRTFPSPYAPTGDEAKDRLAFFHVIERLKTQKRQGWLDHKIPDAESISDHMYRMAMLALCSNDISLDIGKCVMLAVVHDLAEAQVGDITPHEGITKAEKNALEAAAIENFVRDMLHESPAGQRIRTLWTEYELGATNEARFVKDLDRFELSLQTVEYEGRHAAQDLQPFLNSSLPNIRHPEVREWATSLVNERDSLKTPVVEDRE